MAETDTYSTYVPDLWINYSIFCRKQRITCFLKQGSRPPSWPPTPNSPSLASIFSNSVPFSKWEQITLRSFMYVKTESFRLCVWTKQDISYPGTEAMEAVSHPVCVARNQTPVLWEQQALLSAKPSLQLQREPQQVLLQGRNPWWVELSASSASSLGNESFTPRRRTVTDNCHWTRAKQPPTTEYLLLPLVQFRVDLLAQGSSCMNVREPIGAQSGNQMSSSTILYWLTACGWTQNSPIMASLAHHTVLEACLCLQRTEITGRCQSFPAFLWA